MYGTYGPPYYEEKRHFWEDVVDWIGNEKLPWLIFGDLNEIIDESERFGGRGLIGRRLFLKDFMQQVGAIDFGFCRRRYTWVNM